MKKNRPLLFLPFFLLFYISQINGYDGTSINNLSTALPISGETICLNSEFCLSDTTNFVKDTVMVDIAILQVPCFGEANGSLQASLSGGNPGYNFSWLDKDNEVINNNTLILKNAEAGVYKISGTDADNRAFEASIILPSIPEIQISFADIRGPSCFNPGFSERDGAATALVNYADGSTGSFTFFWPTGQVEIGSESRVSNLGSGQIEVLVFETNGICSSKSSVVIPSPEQLVYDTVNSIVTPVTCFGNGDGSILVSAKGGTGPYTYLWDYENWTSPTIKDLPAGTYVVTITDANDCITTQSIDIIEPEPMVLDLDFSNGNTRNVDCPNEATGQLSILASGANIAQGGVNYEWRNTTAVGSIATNLTAGDYSVTVRDTLGCLDSITYRVSQPPPIQYNIFHAAPILCNGGVTTLITDPLSFSGGNGGEYLFSIDNNPPQTLDKVVQVRAGEHTIKVIDSSGCENITTIYIVEPIPLSVSIDTIINSCLEGATINLSIINGNPIAKSELFLNGDTIKPGIQPTVWTELRAGVYDIQVVDVNDCSASLLGIEIGDACNNDSLSTSITFQQSSKADILLFPNPATTQLDINFTDFSSSKLYLSISNMVGKVYYREVLPIRTNTTQIEVSTFERGVYIVQVMDEQGNGIRKKMVVD